MASIWTTCVVCGKQFRLVGNGSQTTEELTEAVAHVHPVGTDGDEDCAKRYVAQQAKAAEEAAAAELARAQALVDASKGKAKS